MLDTIDFPRHRRELPPLITPCDSCKYAGRCKSEALACQAFVLFKRCSTSPSRWCRAPRLPSKDLYERAMQPLEPKTKSRPLPVCEDEAEFEFGVAFDFEGAFADDYG
jgi:hypothetical protein